MGPAGRAVVLRAVDGDAGSPSRHRADHRPAVRHRALVGNVASSAWSSPPPRMNCIGSAPSRGADGVQRLGDLERAPSYVDGDARVGRRGGRRRRAARRRCRSSRWRRRRRRPARRRTAARGGGRPRPAPAGSGSRGRARPARRPPSPGGRRARARRRPGRRSGPPAPRVHAPSTVTAITIWSARVRSPPTTLAPTRAHSSANPSAKSSAHCTGRSAGRGEPDGQRGRPAAHRVDVGEVLGGGAVADVGRPRPSRGGSAGPRPSGRSRPRRGRCGPAARRRRRPARPAPARPARRRLTSSAIRPNSPASARVASGGTAWRHPTRRRRFRDVAPPYRHAGPGAVGWAREHTTRNDARSARWSSRRTS